MKWDCRSIAFLPIESAPYPVLMISETPCSPLARCYERVARPNGITVTCYGAGASDQQVSRVKALGMGGLFLCGSCVKPIGTSLKLIFEVPGGLVFAADAVVRNIRPGEGMGVEFTKIGPQDRAQLLLDRSVQEPLVSSPRVSVLQAQNPPRPDRCSSPASSSHWPLHRPLRCVRRDVHVYTLRSMEIRARTS